MFYGVNDFIGGKYACVLKRKTAVHVSATFAYSIALGG